jgi:hypothetical protein
MDIVTSARVDAALARIKGLFLEMPGVSLNTEQACDLTGLDVVTCLALLLALERGGFLRRSRRVTSCFGTSMPAWTWTVTRGEAHGH